MDELNKACGDIISFIKSNANPTDTFYETVEMLRFLPHFDPNKSGYNLLVSKGVGIISNDSFFINLVFAIAYENNIVQSRAQKIERHVLAILNQLKNELELNGRHECLADLVSEISKTIFMDC